jgi:hypothetical protein
MRVLPETSPFRNKEALGVFVEMFFDLHVQIGTRGFLSIRTHSGNRSPVYRNSLCCHAGAPRGLFGPKVEA